jgi:hypothetical protein
VTLEHVTYDEICAVVHKLHLTDLSLLENHKKLEVMESCHYLANVTQTKSALQTISPMKGDPQSKSLVLKCTLYLKDFQNKGRVTLKKWVELEQAQPLSETSHPKVSPQPMLALQNGCHLGRSPQT